MQNGSVEHVTYVDVLLALVNVVQVVMLAWIANCQLNGRKPKRRKRK